MSSSEQSGLGWLTTTPIAHRGLHTLPHAPENSLKAFAAAVTAGFPIELDVRLLADGAVAVFHDHDLQRLTGAAGVLEEQTTAQIQQRRLLGTDEHVPLLIETLALVAGRVPILVEIKTEAASTERLEWATLQALKGYEGEIAIQSFSPAILAFLAEQAPQIRRGQLAADDHWQDAEGWADIADPPDFIAYHLQALPTPLSSALRARGVPLLSWTIQTLEEQRRAAAVSDNCIFEGFHPASFGS